MPKKFKQPLYMIFAILVEIITSLLFLNMFVGVVVETFYTQKADVSGEGRLTENQRSYINIAIMGYQAKPLLKLKYD
jgi:hypothetical protein